MNGKRKTTRTGSHVARNEGMGALPRRRKASATAEATAASEVTTATAVARERGTLFERLRKTDDIARRTLLDETFLSWAKCCEYTAYETCIKAYEYAHWYNTKDGETVYGYIQFFYPESLALMEVQQALEEISNNSCIEALSDVIVYK